VIYVNTVSGAYQSPPHFNLYRAELEPVFASYKSWADAISANASWIMFGLNSQFYSRELALEPIVASFKSWIETSLFPDPTDTFSYWPSTAMRLEEAKTARNLLEEFIALKQNWDGYGASPISDEARGHARRFVDMIEAAPGAPPMPEISPMPSGTISFEWETPRVHAYLEIGSTLYSGFIKTEQGPLLLQGSADYLDQHIVSLIQRAISAPVSLSAPITEIHRQVPQYDLSPA
jgi:hypothetical protein